MTEQIDQHAASNLRFIREAMERASSFTSIPGWGGVGAGLIGLSASVAAHDYASSDARRWLLVWMAVAPLAAMIGTLAMFRKARRAGTALTTRAARRFFVAYLAPLGAAAVITFLLLRHQVIEPLPAVWLLLYGTSFVGSGAHSLRVVPVMGLCFMVLGVAAAFVSLPAANILMGVGFGGLHLLFGWIIVRTYGG